MKEKEITNLLTRFMDGNTTVEEETTLAHFFCNATNSQKPAAMTQEDWEACKEMFGMLYENADCLPRPSTHARISRRLWGYLAAACAAAAIVQASLTLNTGTNGQAPILADNGSRDTAKVITTPACTTADSCREKTMPASKTINRKQQKLPYHLPHPKPMLASNGMQGQAKTVGTTGHIKADSMAMALAEAERLVNAMSVYQEIRINEICDVEFEPQY